MNKKNKIVLCLLASTICMTACGNSIPEMTQEQKDLVVQYAAGTLLEHLNESGTRLVDTSEPKEEPTLADAVTVTPEGKSSVSENDIATDEAPKQAMENKETAQISATQLLQIEPLTITYTGYEICDSYPEQGEEDLYFSVEAGAGKKLLVLQVAVTNPGQEQVEFDTLHKQNIKYRVMLNGADRHQVMLTMLDNDFSAMDIMINPGETMQTVLLAEVSEETAGQIASVDLVIRSDSDEVMLTP